MDFDLVWGGRVVRWCWVNFQCQGVLLVSIRVGRGPTALAVGAGWGCFAFFTHVKEMCKTYRDLAYSDSG